MSDDQVFQEPEVLEAVEHAREARAAEAKADPDGGAAIESAEVKVRRAQRLTRWMRRSGRL